MIIPILHLEKELQIKDLTRFDASKSTLVKGSANPINAVSITPGANGTPISVFNASASNWFADFAFNSFAFDVDSTNNKLSFESANVTYDEELSAGTYTIDTLLVEIKDTIEDACPLTVTVSLDDQRRINLVADGSLKILLKTGAHILKHLGFYEDGQLIGTPVEYGLRKITLTVASSSESASVDEYVKVYSVEGDALFSNDSDLVGNESDIMSWLPKGRATYIDLHRRAQRSIIDWFDRNGYRDHKGRKITKFAVIDNTDVKLWSIYLSLRFFFMGVQNASEDVFKEKAKYYEKMEIESRNRAVLNFDLDGDGKEDQSIGPSSWSGSLFLR